jgi:hypothetical protein
LRFAPYLKIEARERVELVLGEAAARVHRVGLEPVEQPARGADGLAVGGGRLARDPVEQGALDVALVLDPDLRRLVVPVVRVGLVLRGVGRARQLPATAQDLRVVEDRDGVDRHRDAAQIAFRLRRPGEQQLVGVDQRHRRAATGDREGVACDGGDDHLLPRAGGDDDVVLGELGAGGDVEGDGGAARSDDRVEARQDVVLERLELRVGGADLGERLKEGGERCLVGDEHLDLVRHLDLLLLRRK